MQDEYGQEKLSREAFYDALKELVTEALGVGYQVERMPVRKNNGVWRETLLIRAEDRDCAPSFYLEEMYCSYCMGQPVEALAEHIAETVRREYSDRVGEMSHILKKEWFEERLFLRLVHFEKNRKALEHAVYVKVQDLAAVFYVLTERDADGLKSFCLPRYAWEQAELGTAEAYYDTILKNTERLFPPKIMRIEEGLLWCMEQEGEEAAEWLKRELEEMIRENRKPLFYVLTNTDKINGAAVILYEGLLKKLADRFESGFWVIPSSVHEVLLLLTTEETEETLNRMIREVNKTQLEPEDVLSDHVYYYAKERGFGSREK
ncbi:MAG: hypothetical protein IJW37_02220 [Lachnospiraceae bacterium]|nr:hypothetical protein [Lachnospiraceae bacterium]